MACIAMDPRVAMGIEEAPRQYSSLRLFRQRFDGDWSGVFNAMQRELKYIRLGRRD